MEQNLANLYRPVKFGDVVGQPAAVETLRRIACADGIAARAVFLRGAYGSGKCIAGHQRVSTSLGYVPIASLRPEGAGDGFAEFVVDVEQPDGSYLPTSHFYSERGVELYSLKCKSGCTYTGTAAHPIMTYRVGSGRVELVKVGDLRVGDYVARRWVSALGLSDSLCAFADLEDYVKLGMYLCGVYSNSYFFYPVHKHFGRQLDMGVPPEVFTSKVHAVSMLAGMVSEIGCLSSSGRLMLAFTNDAVASGVQECLDWLGLVYEVRSSFGAGKLCYRSDRYVHTGDMTCVCLDRASTVVLGELLKSCSDRLNNIMRYDDEIWYHLDLWSEGVSRRHRSRFCGGFDLGDDFMQLVEDIRRACALLRKEYRGNAEIAAVRSFGQNIAGQVRVASEGLEWAAEVLERHDVSLSASTMSFCGVRLDRIERIGSVVSDVYDLSVPESHLFMSAGVVNHNTTLSRIMGKAMNCSRLKTEGDVCGECDGCKEGSAAVSNTYWELDGTVVGNVEGIRTLRDRLQLVPDGRRVVVLDEIQASSQGSMNALLKLVEEGVPNTMFIFSGTEDILPTLKSRCVNIDISTIPLGVIEEYIGKVAASRGVSIGSSELSILAAKSQGHMRDALQLLQHYELIGGAALDTSYFKFRDFIASCFSKSGKYDPEVLLEGVLQYPIVDIRYSIGLLLRTVYSTVDSDSLEYKFAKNKLGDVLFKFFFNPSAQVALQSEMGVEILLRSLIEKTANIRSHE